MATIYRKTAKGQAEIETRALRLAPRLRSALILVDGRKTDTELAKLILAEPEQTLASLLADGFVEVVGITLDKPASQRSAAAAGAAAPTSADRSVAIASLKRDAVRALNDQLGPNAEGIAIKIERSMSLAELRPLLVSAQHLLRDARGAAAAESFRARFVADDAS